MTALDIEPTGENKRRALKLLWKLEDAIYEATTERPFSGFVVDHDGETGKPVYPDEPQTDAGFTALTEIWIVMLGLDRAGPDPQKDEVREALAAAAEAREGDSNDDEIEALWECAELLSAVTGVPIPEVEE